LFNNDALVNPVVDSTKSREAKRSLACQDDGSKTTIEQACQSNLIGNIEIQSRNSNMNMDMTNMSSHQPDHYSPRIKNITIDQDNQFEAKLPTSRQQGLRKTVGLLKSPKSPTD
jgi:hypothetical protein